MGCRKKECMVYPLVNQKNTKKQPSEMTKRIVKVKKTRGPILASFGVKQLSLVSGANRVKNAPHEVSKSNRQSNNGCQEQNARRRILQVRTLLTKQILEALKLISSKVGGVKESFAKALNRVEHLAEPNSYGLILDDC